MKKQKKIKNRGFSLTELMLVIALASTCMVSVGFIFLDNQRAWNDTYIKANSTIMLDSHRAGKAFDATVRKASAEKYLIDSAGQWVEVYYFDSEASAKIDRYARLYVTGGTFYIEHGIPDPRQTLYTNPICQHVTAFYFTNSGRCIRMQMTLSDDNGTDVSFISSAIPQNE